MEKLVAASPPPILDVGDRSLVRNGERRVLSPKDFALLYYLSRHRDRVVPHHELLEAVWPDVHVVPDVLKVRVARLRRILGDDSGAPRFIVNSHGEGYRFLAPIVIRDSDVSGRPVAALNAAQSNAMPRTAVKHASGAHCVVGRDFEHAALDRFLECAADGTRQIVFVSGEPGIGKTTLIDLFLAALGPGSDAGAGPTGSSEGRRLPPVWIGRGQCVEQYGQGEPFLPIMQALDSLGRHGGRGELVSVLRQAAPTWLAELPSLIDIEERQRLSRPSNPAPAWNRMLRELAEALETLSAPRFDGSRAVLVLVLEDLHWADPSTIDLLAVVARRREPARLLVIASYRTGEPVQTDAPLRALLQELRVHSIGNELALGPISESDVASYLATRFGGAIPADVIRRLHCRSDGNPLFLIDIVRDLVANGLIANADGAWKVEGIAAAVGVTTPSSIRQLVGRQRDRMAAGDCRLLEAASVAGSEFSSYELAAALECDVTDVEETCLRLAERDQFVRLDGVHAWPDGTEAMRFRFLHELYREVWRGRVTAALRRTWHLRIGECKERAYGVAAHQIASELAEHFAQGGDLWRAVAYHGEANRQAVGRGARVEARAHLDQGLRLLAHLPDTPERRRQELRLQVDLGALLSVTEGYAASGTAAAYYRAREICTELGDVAESFQTIFGLSRFFWMKGDLASALDLAEQLLRIADHGNDPVCAMAAHAAHAEVATLRGDVEAAARSVELGLELARVHWDDSLLVDYVYGHLGVMCAGCGATVWQLLGRCERAFRYRDESVAMARASGHPFALGLAYWGAAIFHQLRHDWREVDGYAQELAAISARHETAEFFPFVELFQGWALATRGDPERGAVHARHAADTLHAVGAGLFEPYAFGLAAECCGRAGRFDEALTLASDALIAAARNGPGVHDAELHRLRGQLRLDEAMASQPGKVSDEVACEVEAWFVRALEIARGQGIRWWELRASVALGELWRRRGMDARARALVAASCARVSDGFDSGDLLAARSFIE